MKVEIRLNKEQRDAIHHALIQDLLSESTGKENSFSVYSWALEKAKKYLNDDSTEGRFYMERELNRIRWELEERQGIHLTASIETVEGKIYHQRFIVNKQQEQQQFLRKHFQYYINKAGYISRRVENAINDKNIPLPEDNPWIQLGHTLTKNYLGNKNELKKLDDLPLLTEGKPQEDKLQTTSANNAKEQSKRKPKRKDLPRN